MIIKELSERTISEEWLSVRAVYTRGNKEAKTHYLSLTGEDKEPQFNQLITINTIIPLDP